MKCSQCGKELVTGDIHWEMGICNHCYNSVFSDVFINEKAIVYPSVVNISVDDFEEYKKALHRIAVLERALIHQMVAKVVIIIKFVIKHL